MFKLKSIGSIATKKKCKHHFFRYSRVANSVVSGQMRLTFKLMQPLTCVHITCKYQKDQFKNNRELELMFMKHYTPNRCLYIKVAKLRTGVGSAEMSHLQNCSLKIYLKRALGGGGGGGGGGRVGGQDGCERRIKVAVKFFVFFWGGGGGGVGGVGLVRVDVN